METPKGWKELDIDVDDDNVVAYETEEGTIFIGITPGNNGRTKGGEGKNIDCGGTHGYRALTGGMIKGAKLNLHLIRKPVGKE
jgi:hypothetical protein